MISLIGINQLNRMKTKFLIKFTIYMSHQWYLKCKLQIQIRKTNMLYFKVLILTIKINNQFSKCRMFQFLVNLYNKIIINII
jgi:hypothetical protein